MGMQIRRAIWKASLTMIIISLLGFGMALAASGDLDTTFSGDGRQTTTFGLNFSYRIMGLALQSDGKVVAVGMRWDPPQSGPDTHDFAVARYNSNGTLDTTFSGDGRLLTNFGAMDGASDVAVQSDGKIVVSGKKCNSSGVCDLAIARYSTNGSLDTTFSGDGRQVIPFGTGDNGSAGGLRIQADGKILVAGYMKNTHGDLDFAVYRLGTSGALDTTFSGDGKVNFGFGSGSVDVARDLMLQGGKIVVSGETCVAGGCNFALARLTSTGALDTTFSGDGKQTTDFGGRDRGYDLARQADGKIVVVGVRAMGTVDSVAVARYNLNGTLDSTFSGDGRLTFPMGTTSSGEDVLVQGDGKIVVAGHAYNGTNDDFALARLNSNGSVDTTFSGDGKLRINFGGYDYAHALLRQSDGKYLLGGDAYDGVSVWFALARVLP